MPTDRLKEDAQRLWDAGGLPALRRHIEIPAKSPDFDADWQAHGYIDQVVENARAWCQAHAPPGTTIDVISGEVNESSKPRTPVLVIEVPATGSSKETVLMYGHLDKQPEMKGWDRKRKLAPWKAVDIHESDGHKLYGRGGADDGYAVFMAIISLVTLEMQDIPHARAVILIETGEESGSPDLPFYLDLLRPRIGKPSLIIALDSGCESYDRLWMTTSLRGLVMIYLDVQVLTESMHSGDAGGIVPDSSRISRWVLSHIEDAQTGRILLPEFYAVEPTLVHVQSLTAASVIGSGFVDKIPWAGDTPDVRDAEGVAQMLLNRTWRPALTTTGADGYPPTKRAGNTLRKGTRYKYSIRIPPTVDHQAAAAAVEAVLNAVEVPDNVVVTYKLVSRASWLCPARVDWLERAVNEASVDVFGHPSADMSEGGAIPFMAQLEKAYSGAGFVITGLLGPGSHAHGENESLHVDFLKSLTVAVSHLLAAHAQHFLI